MLPGRSRECTEKGEAAEHRRNKVLLKALRKKMTDNLNNQWKETNVILSNFLA